MTGGWARLVGWTQRHPARAVIALTAGVGCAASPASPLPWTPLSVLLLVALGALVTVMSATARWWVLGGAAAIAVLVAVDPLPASLAVVSFVGACWCGIRQGDASHRLELHAAVGALLLNALARSGLTTDGFFATSTVVTVIVAVALVIDGLRRAGPTAVAAIRSFVRHVWTPLALLVGVALVGFVAAAAMAADDLRTGKRLARAALSALDHGDFAKAADLFDDAHRSFAAADSQLGRPWAWPAQAVPGLAQQADAVWSLAGEAAGASSTIASTVDGLDPDSVRVADGRIDLAAIAALAEPFRRLDESLDDIRAVTERADSGWLLDPLAGEVRELQGDLVRNGRLLDNARMAIDLAPAMLGADGPRTYLVLFTTPAEARGLGGFPGNFAELTADDGHLEMTRFGRWSELESAIDPATLHIEGPPGFIDRYGAFGYELSADGRLKGSPWRNLTMPPDFPTVAQVATELYPQSGGRALDGVMLADVEVLSRLLGFTGPVTVDGWPEPITAKNAQRVLLVDQYSIEGRTDRVDFLSDVAREVFDRLLGGALPGPVELARVLGPEVVEGRLLMWTDRPDEQRMLAATRLIGAFPGPPLFDGADGFGVAITNVAGNKLDTFLDRSFVYDTKHGDDGQVTSTLHIALTNAAPVDELPDYVVSNAMRLPDGTNRSRVCVTSPLRLVAGTVDGDEEVPWERIEEFGGTSYCRSVTIGRGDTVTLVLDLEGRVANGDRPVVVWSQPLVRQPSLRVAVG